MAARIPDRTTMAARLPDRAVTTAARIPDRAPAGSAPTLSPSDLS
jgi:hypothetical protein